MRIQGGRIALVGFDAVMRVSMKSLVPIALLGVGSVVAAQAPSLAMMAQLQRGQWTVTADDGSPPRRVCLGDPAQLFRLRHAATPNCNRFVVEDEPGKVTVQYTCRGNGYGRTSVRRETDALVQIESQGTAGGRPFQFRAEARRTGPCR